MTPEYLAIIHTAIGNVQRVMEAAGDEYVVVVTADHGGMTGITGVN
jgi:predicted AlkP superfamily pyrophosphatase or phosphodiesterase